MKDLDKIIKKLRKKNPIAYAELLHGLAHAIPVDEIEGMLGHAKDIANDSDDTDDEVDPRAVAIAEALESTAKEYREGKHKIDEDATGVDVKIAQIKKGE